MEVYPYIFGQFAEATDRRGERWFRGSDYVETGKSRHVFQLQPSGHHCASLSAILGRIRWSYFFLFPQLVKTADLDPRHNYVMGFHPHGVLVAGAFTNFCTYATGFRQLFPGITSYLLMLPLWFRAPFFRDYIMCAGADQRCLNPTASDRPLSL